MLYIDDNIFMFLLLIIRMNKIEVSPMIHHFYEHHFVMIKIIFVSVKN